MKKALALLICLLLVISTVFLVAATGNKLFSIDADGVEKLTLRNGWGGARELDATMDRTLIARIIKSLNDFEYGEVVEEEFPPAPGWYVMIDVTNNDGEKQTIEIGVHGVYVTTYATDSSSSGQRLQYMSVDPDYFGQEWTELLFGKTLPLFEDINMWAKNSIEWVYEQGLFSGKSDTKFSPNGKMSRAMLATVLWRLAGKPAVSGSSGFSDVPSGQYYSDAVKWAADSGIVTGTGGGKFSPNGNVSRQDLAVMLHRYAGGTSGTANISVYLDAGKVSGYAEEAVKWAVGSGIITGKSGKLDPKGNATRAEVATMMMRFAG